MHYTILSPKSYKAISESIRNFNGYRQRVFYEMLPFVIITEALYSHTVSKSILNSHTNKIEEMCQKRNNVKMLSISTPATTIVSNITLVSEVNCWKLCRVFTNPANMNCSPHQNQIFVIKIVKNTECARKLVSDQKVDGDIFIANESELCLNMRNFENSIIPHWNGVYSPLKNTQFEIIYCYFNQ